MAKKKTNPLVGHTPFELLEGITIAPQGRRHVAIGLPEWVPMPDDMLMLFPTKVPLGQLRSARRALYRLCLRMDRAMRATKKPAARRKS